MERIAPMMVIVCITAIGCSAAEDRQWPAEADPATNIALMLAPENQVIKDGEYPVFIATLVNRGKNEVMLVEPGDGSECGWRTPLVEWSRQARYRGGRCGNINELRMDEVFVLRPGESRVLKEWIGRPYLSGPGKYPVSMSYKNQPDREWMGLPLGKHDSKAIERIRHSTAVSITSNTVVVVVERK